MTMYFYCYHFGLLNGGKYLTILVCRKNVPFNIESFTGSPLILLVLFYVLQRETGGSVIPAAVKMPDNKFATIIKPRINMPAVKTPDKKFA